MKNRLFFNVLCSVLIAGLLSSCMGMEESDPSSLSVPEMKTFEVNDNGSLVFELTATVDKSAIGRIASCGFYYGKKKDMSDAERIECKMMGNTFAADLTLREYGETFYACSYISNGLGSSEICSDPRTISVGDLEDYVSFEAPVVLSYDKTQAEVQIKYVAEEGVEVSEYGVCYGETKDLDINDGTVKAHSDKAVIEGLKTGESYYMCAYLKDGLSVIYGKSVPLAVYGVPEVKTDQDPETESDSAILCGEILSSCGKEITECGFLWCEGAVDALSVDKDTKIKCASKDSKYSESLDGLSPNRTYSFCAYAVNAEGVSYGQVVRFTTGMALPEHGDPSVSGITSSSAIVAGNVLSDGGEAASERGFCWGLDKTVGNKVVCKESDFAYTLTGLKRNTTYYVKSYSTNTKGTSGSDIIEFRTLAELPVVETSDVTDITDMSAVCGGKIVDDGGTNITAMGIVWSAFPNPTKENGNIIAGQGDEVFLSSITGLSPNTVYHVRAYVENSMGVSYGEPKTFTTKVALSELGELNLLNSTSSSLSISGSLIYDGGEAPSETGFYYSLSDDCDPLTSSKLSAQLSGKEFSAEVSGLLRATTYHVRAYAVNSAGESVSEIVSLRTLAELPVVETSDVTDITGMSAVCGGKIVDDGGSEIIEKGVVWSTDPDPTVNLSTKTNDAGKEDSFQSDITDLLPGSTYYVRAYATNTVGTSYGETREFQTSDLDWSKVTDLSSSGTANCYILSESGIYKFPTVKGNSTESVGSVKSVDVLWETFGTSTAPDVGDLISFVLYKDGYIALQTSENFKEGNAVIAAKDASGKILWSWHIWLTDRPQGQVYYNNAGTMMDRNLGATSATPGDVGALGLLYQWGRKDPFLGSSSISSNTLAKSTITWPSAVTSSSATGTVDYAILNPTTFLSPSSYSEYDWHYASRDNTLWTTSTTTKSIYDPCPSGWRVPDGGENGIWSKALGSSSYFKDALLYDSTNEGMNFSGKFGSASTIWYPASGYRSYVDGDLYYVGISGSYWSVTPSGSDAYGLSFLNSGYVYPSSGNSRAYRQSVRCLQE